MRWEKSVSASSNEIYHLWQKDKKLLTLTLHPFSNTARVESPLEQRVFLIRKEGLFRNKTVLRNEYGIKVGELGLENENRFIDVNDERYYYHIEESPIAQMIIYSDTRENPIVICGLNVTDGNASVKFEHDKSLVSKTGLLMALCWYMFMPTAQERKTEMAV